MADTQQQYDLDLDNLDNLGGLADAAKSNQKALADLGEHLSQMLSRIAMPRLPNLFIESAMEAQKKMAASLASAIDIPKMMQQTLNNIILPSNFIIEKPTYLIPSSPPVIDIDLKKRMAINKKQTIIIFFIILLLRSLSITF